MTYAPLSFLAALTLYKYGIGAIRPSRLLNSIYLIVGLIIGIAIMAVPIIIYNKESLFPLMNDPFAVASLKNAVAWSGYEFLIGIFFLAGVVVSYLLLVKQKWERLSMVITANMGITLLLVLFFILPKIESFTQGPNITFLESIQGEECYVESYGYKSYAQYYYADQPYGLKEARKDQKWLLEGEIDKPVYMISKITNTELDAHPNFTKIRTEGGFSFYRRTP